MEKWVTESIYVDVDTGEIIDKILTKKRNYKIIRKTSKIKNYEEHKSKTIINECRRHQYGIEF